MSKTTPSSKTVLRMSTDANTKTGAGLSALSGGGLAVQFRLSQLEKQVRDLEGALKKSDEYIEILEKRVGSGCSQESV
jgi:hypothetical protein